MRLFGDRKFGADKNGLTCLHWAVLGGSLTVVRYLVDKCEPDLGSKTKVSYGMVHDTVCTPIGGCFVRHDTCYCKAQQNTHSPVCTYKSTWNDTTASAVCVVPK